MKSKNSNEIILSIRNLNVVFPLAQGELKALEDINLDIYRGETIGIVGESGCGKSTLGFSILNAVPSPGKIISGEILFHGEDILKKPRSELRKLRGKKISMIFQDPMTSLNPLLRVDKHILETIKVHEGDTKKHQALERAKNLLKKLGISENRITDYPHQLSGGMRQRVMIGIGLALNAEIIIADEPTTSLDVIVEAQFLQLLKTLKEEFGLTLILITHNMGIVAEISDRIVVMYGGKIMEIGNAEDVFSEPLHPYTRGLLHSIPNIHLLEEEKLELMEGFPPDLTNPPPGCRFSPRCKEAFDRCVESSPPMIEIPGMKGRLVRCFLYEKSHISHAGKVINSK